MKLQNFTVQLCQFLVNPEIMGGLTSSTEEAIAARKVAKEVNYALNNQLKRDHLSIIKGKIMYFSVKETEPILSMFLHYE